MTQRLARSPWLTNARILTTALMLVFAVTALSPGQLFAQSGTPSPEAITARDSPLLDLTLTDIAALKAEGGMTVTSYTPGGSSVERAATSVEVLYIAAGPMTVSVVEAPQPMRVIPSREATAEESESLLSAGQDLVLETGTTLVAPPGAIIELRNDGASPTTMLDLLWATSSTSVESSGAMWGKATGGKLQDLTPPVSILLRRLSLDAGATIPAPASAETAQSAAVVDPERSLDLRSSSDGAIINGGDEPLEIYLLTVSGAAAPPVAAT